ncbi:hypothetical protein N5B55_04845 [Ralstonia pickettii]|uniref:hypothetical protein n=1 Tax=Ralstonia pickettii TaxID=329 RepID=UPI0027154F45|nr:hypothetical protein [Ralstonia pickettii]WKZ86281.1 hypothetical protein N5B55_04845 [Ralstonia pickettii]
MARLFIPPLGSELILAADWTFSLFAEYRNTALFKALKLKEPRDKYGCYDPNLSAPVALPAGTTLFVRRYYIRQGMKGFDSVTFSAKIGKKQHRFWVKLEDANRMEFDFVEH